MPVKRLNRSVVAGDDGKVANCKLLMLISLPIILALGGKVGKDPVAKREEPVAAQALGLPGVLPAKLSVKGMSTLSCTNAVGQLAMLNP